MSAPDLSRREVEAAVRTWSATRRRSLMAFYGKGDEDVVDIEGTPVRVIPVRSELDLRRRLLEIRRDEHAAFLIPWRAASLPIDLQGRFALDGKIRMVGRDERLKILFGVSEIDEEARDSSLAGYLITHHATDTFVVTGGRLTLDMLWSAWLAKSWGLEAGGELALDILVGWASVDARGPQFVSTLTERKAESVRTELLEHLGKRLGAAAPAAWIAWETGRGAHALELALIVGAFAGASDPVVSMWTRNESKLIFGAEVSDVAIGQLGKVADAALRYLARRGDPSAIRTLVRDADQRAARHPELAHYVVGSSRLPSAWRARFDRLGDALAAVAAAPNPTTVAAAVSVSGELWRHEMASEPEQLPVLRRTQMALRLASWLAVRPDRDLPPSNTSHGDVENLAGWYASEGGYIDLARRAARGAEQDRFGSGVAAVLAAVDAARCELDRRFARALPSWHEAGRPATQLLPIDSAVKRIATTFLEENPSRRLLVVLMDGMAWAQAVELLESMGNRASVWGPLAWHGMAAHRIGDGPYPAVLTNFPTITEVSRSGFFGGRPVAPGSTTNASNDTDKWKSNRDAQKYVDKNSLPQLLLHGEVQGKDGVAAPEALELVQGSHRIVAVVINAIDMSLKSDRTHHLEWKLDNVNALRDLLDKAVEASRAVLLCSDHGHVPADLMVSSGPATNGARWRTLASSTDPIAEWEVGVRAGDGVWAPRGAHGVAMISDDAHRYGGSAGAGEHGGASLAEVVAPCVLIGCADVVAAVDDPAQAVRPAKPPSWWFFDVPKVDAIAVAEPPKKPSRKPKQSPVPQPFLPAFAPPATPPLVVVSAVRAVAPSPLTTSQLFLARAPEGPMRDRALRAVEFLRARSGVAAAQAFAAELGEFVARVGGLVARLQEILNVDGYQVIRFDRQQQQVHLDLQKLAQQFDVRL